VLRHGGRDSLGPGASHRRRVSSPGSFRHAPSATKQLETTRLYRVSASTRNSASPADGQSSTWLVGLAVALTFMLHVRTGTAPHTEGDEVVYLGLSQEMGWDLSNYTVRDVPRVNRLPNALYRSEVFPHPPLYPYLLKLFDAPFRTGAERVLDLWPLLAIGLGLKLLAVFTMRRLLRRLSGVEWVAALGAFAVAAAPILSFTSTRLLTDTAFEALLLWSVAALIEAVHSERLRDWFLGGLAFSLFLNTKYQAIGFLPVPAIVLSYVLVGQQSRRAWLARHGKHIAVAALPVLLLGLSHHLRMWWVYGTPGIAHLMEVQYPANEFVTRLANRSLPQLWFYMLLMYPAWVLWLSPMYWSGWVASLRERDASALPQALALYALAVISLTTFNQERYWASFEIFMLAAFMVHLSRAPRTSGSLFFGALSLVAMLWSSYFNCVALPGSTTALVQPALSLLAPGLIVYP
jgi:4-amino-4-deoxy-L-arabinose transferase-like glycosyltransferase